MIRPKHESAEFCGKRVLLVDDEADMRTLLKMWLSGQGFDVSVAADGIEALSRIQEQVPDVIVTDHSMPRMNGLELCSTLRARTNTRHIPIILCSGLPPSPRMDGMFERFMLKPASLNEISDEIWSLLAAAN